MSTGTLSPAFTPGRFSYTTSVAYNVNSITVTPTAANAGATVTVNDIIVPGGSPSASINLSEGSNTITTIVTSQDGTSTSTYTISVTRAAVPSSNAKLSNLVLNHGTLSPAFASGDSSYLASVAYSITSITVKPTAADVSATITVNGSPVASGSKSDSINLSVGFNLITAIVRAEDGITTRTYTVVVTRAQPSSNAKLSNLVLSGSELSPAFATGTTTYTANVDFGVPSITITPTVANANATVKVNDIPVASGSPATISLSSGDNTINIIVTAQDGITSKTYKVIVNVFAGETKVNSGNKVNGKEQNPITKEKDLQVYPNPSNGQFTVRLSNFTDQQVTIQIVNENGKMITQKSVSLNNKTTMTSIDFNLSLAAGIYFVKVITVKGVQTAKLIVQR